jgi:hypothetical protein
MNVLSQLHSPSHAPGINKRNTGFKDGHDLSVGACTRTTALPQATERARSQSGIGIFFNP